uniref:Uncharacterized protein n=1 Tax=Ditylenchus dipsaci TaxID=166011 RepID=A0A915E7U5_9BILA
MGNIISENQHQVADSAPRTILETGGSDGIIPVISASNQQILDLVNSRFNQLESRISRVEAKQKKLSRHHHQHRRHIRHHPHHHLQEATSGERGLTLISSTGLRLSAEW